MAIARVAAEIVVRSVAARRGRVAGFSLFDLLATLGVIAIAAALGLPELFRATEQTRLALGASEIASSLRLTRVYALRHSANVAIKFSTAHRRHRQLRPVSRRG